MTKSAKLSLVVATLLVGLLIPASVGAISFTPSCVEHQKAGYYRAQCEIPGPASFMFSGVARQPYIMTWLLSCYKTHKAWQAGMATEQPLAEHRVVQNGFGYPNNDQQAVAALDEMAGQSHCTLWMWFTRLNRAKAHLLTGAIYINGGQAGLIYDLTAAGQ